MSNFYILVGQCLGSTRSLCLLSSSCGNIKNFNYFFCLQSWNLFFQDILADLIPLILHLHGRVWLLPAYVGATFLCLRKGENLEWGWYNCFSGIIECGLCWQRAPWMRVRPPFQPLPLTDHGWGGMGQRLRQHVSSGTSALFPSNTVTEHVCGQCWDMGMAFSSTCFQPYCPSASRSVNGQVDGEGWENNPWIMNQLWRAGSKILNEF